MSPAQHCDSPTAKRRAAMACRRISARMGVARETIRNWVENIPNGHSANASTPKDCRIKLSKETKP